MKVIHKYKNEECHFTKMCIWVSSTILFYTIYNLTPIIY